MIVSLKFFSAEFRELKISFPDEQTVDLKKLTLFIYILVYLNFHHLGVSVQRRGQIKFITTWHHQEELFPILSLCFCAKNRISDKISNLFRFSSNDRFNKKMYSSYTLQRFFYYMYNGVSWLWKKHFYQCYNKVIMPAKTDSVSAGNASQLFFSLFLHTLVENIFFHHE